jgi:hypothetical protein
LTLRIECRIAIAKFKLLPSSMAMAMALPHVHLHAACACACARTPQGNQQPQATITREISQAGKRTFC